MRRSIYLFVVACIAILTAPAITHAATPTRPVVLELYTSQGCSSCPPADDVLVRLAADETLLPLSFHVDYWDRLGWKGPFSLADATARQYGYAKILSKTGVYTPQLIVDGTYDVVGSHENAVLAAVARAKRHPTGVRIHLQPQPTKQHLQITLTPENDNKAGGDAVVWAFTYQPHAITQVPRGENGGRTLTSVNNVTSITRVGSWQNGSTTNYEIVLPKAGQGVAVIVQTADGVMLGAARYQP